MLLKLIIFTFFIVVALAALSLTSLWKKMAESYGRHNSDLVKVFSCDTYGINEPDVFAPDGWTKTLNNNVYLRYLCVSQNFRHQNVEISIIK